MAAKYKDAALQYSRDVLEGKIKTGKEVVLACARFQKDLQREDLELHTKEPDLVIGIIERTMVHKQGEDLDGRPLMNTPLKLQPWQIFIVYNLVGFYYKGTNERRYKEAFIFIPRKNGKTTFVAALAWGLAILERKSGATIYIVAASLQQACQPFKFIIHSHHITSPCGNPSITRVTARSNQFVTEFFFGKKAKKIAVFLVIKQIENGRNLPYT